MLVKHSTGHATYNTSTTCGFNFTFHSFSVILVIVVVIIVAVIIVYIDQYIIG